MHRKGTGFGGKKKKKKNLQAHFPILLNNKMQTGDITH